jgi:integrase
LSALPRHVAGKVISLRADSITQAFDRAKERARETYQKECKKSGVKPNPDFLNDLRFHDLRHEATSRLFEKGLNPIEAASITGHKDLRMLKRYTHLDPTKLAIKLG